MLLSKFEQDVFEAMIDRSPLRKQLAEQLSSASIKERRFTGVGVFVRFSVPTTIEPLKEHANFEISDIDMKIDGLEYGAGAVLFVREGYLHMLEFFTYGEPWPEAIVDYQISRTKGSNILWVSEDGKTIKRQH